MMKKYTNILMLALAAVLILALALLFYSGLASNQLPPTTGSNAPPVTAATSTPLPSLKPTQVLPTATVAPAKEIISFPLGIDIKVVEAPFPPPISKETALKALRSRQNATSGWDLDKSTIDGKHITITAVFGLVTQGQPMPRGWSGMVNIPLEKCPVEGECTLTGVVLDHLENRPMWVFDVEGIYQPFAGDPSIKNNHLVFGIDVETLQRIGFGPYKA